MSSNSSQARTRSRLVEINEASLHEEPINDAVHDHNMQDEAPIESSVPSVSRKKAKTSAIWNEFTQYPELQKAKCNHCGFPMAYVGSKSGTSHLANHLKTCEAKRMRSTQRFDMPTIRENIKRFVIESEQSFRIVEHPVFIRMLHSVDPRVQVPSRSTIKRDLIDLYDKEKLKLQQIFRELDSRVSLTTDTWTSIQNVSYMCVTAHFVDANWELHKKCIAFKNISSHSATSIGQMLEEVIREWGIDRLGCVTVDNASPNNGAIDHLKNTFGPRRLLLRGDHMHLRCACHVINLIVEAGLKPSKYIFKKIRKAVKYVRASPERDLAFNKCCELEGVAFNEKLWTDTKTRWNSTYLMLEKAFKFRVVFSRMCLHDESFPSVPTEEEWVGVSKHITFLQTFLNATKALSVVKTPGIHLYSQHMFYVQRAIDKVKENDSGVIFDAITTMEAKLKKYWISDDYVSLIPFVAMLLDPRGKLRCLESIVRVLCKGNGMDDSFVGLLIGKTRNLLKKLYDVYAEDESVSRSTTVSRSSIGLESFFSEAGLDIDSTPPPNKIIEYLDIAGRVEDTVEFDILDWWKGSGYRILKRIARDIFALLYQSLLSLQSPHLVLVAVSSQIFVVS